jgi:hypothetical protein
MSTEITINQDQIDINVDTTVVTIEAPQGGYPLPNNVYSVFGRIGNVVAQEGDYTLTQLGGVTITNPLTGQALVYNGTSWVNNTETYVGTVTSVNMSVPTGLTISGNPITTAGTLALGLASGYSIPTTASQATWNTAYNDSIVSAAVTGVQTKTLTLNQQDGGTITASWTDYDTAPVTSVFGRTGDVTAQNGDYTTTQVTEGTNLYYTQGRFDSAFAAKTTTNLTEGTNLYFTNTRARAAISETVTGLDYDNTTGVLSTSAGYGIPTTASQANWDTAYTNRITSASAPLSIATNAISISQANTTTNGFLSSTDWNTFNNKQAAGNYITALTGEATASGPGSASVTLTNSAVIGKVLTGLNVTGGSVSATDSILAAFGKVQNQINGLIGGSIYQSVWDASTNTPTLTSSVGTKGYYYIVNVAGSTNLNGITDWKVGDWAIYDGTAWQKVDNTDAVSSVNGFTGAVSLTTDNISEGSTNLYFTNARAQAAISGTAPISVTSGVVSISQSGPSTNGYLSSADWNTFNNKVSSATLAGYVPYTGATTNVNLGTHTLSAANLVVNHTSGSGVAASITKGGSGEALTVVKSSGSGNAASITGGVTLLSELNLTTDLADAYIASAATWNAKQNAITLTTTGTSGAATLVGATLNIPQYQAVLTNPVTGTGTTNTLPKFTGTSAIGNSNITDTGSLITLGSNTTISNGALGIGSTSLTNTTLRVSKNITGSNISLGIFQSGVVQSDVTSIAYSFYSAMSTAASSFTAANLLHYSATQGTIGAGSTVNLQTGFYVDSTLIGAGINYGFRGQIPSGTNRWNLYMDGTANNYMAGSLGIGRTALSNIVLGIDKNITGSTVAYGVYTGSTIQSDVTSSVAYYVTSAQTAASSFTLNNLYHYLVSQSTIGLGSTVTSQYGYHVSSNMIGATNNYAFRSQIASGTGRWNLFMDGTADNYLAGALGIGGVQVNSGPILTITLTSGGSGYVDGTYTDVASTNTSSTGSGALFTIIVSGGIVTSATLTWGGMSYKAGDTVTVSNTLLGGAGSGLIITINTVDSSQLTISNANGGDISLLRVDTSLASGDNLGTIKFLSNDTSSKASGLQAEIGAFGQGAFGGAYLSFLTRSGTSNTSLVEAMRIGSEGNIGIGGTTSSDISLRINKAITSAGTTSYGIYSDGVIQSGITSNAIYYATNAQTAAATFTLGGLAHFSAVQGVFGAGSTVTTQYGFLANSNIIGATNNYGFYGNIPSGTNRWNLYMNGTAANYMAGSLLIGGTTNTNAVAKLQVYGSTTASTGNGQLRVSDSANAYKTLSLGFDGTNNLGFIQSLEDGVAYRPLAINSQGGNILIGTTTDVASSIVTMNSTTKGFLPPRMTAAQRAAIASPATGLMVYQTDGTEGVYVYSGGAWKSLTMV